MILLDAFLLALLAVGDTGDRDGTVVLRPMALPQVRAANRLKDPGFEKIGTPASDWRPFDKGYVVDRDTKAEGTQSIRCHADDTKVATGATAEFVLNQTRIVPVVISVKSRCKGVNVPPSGGYCIWVDVIHTDGTPTWGLTRPFYTNTDDWQQQTLTIIPQKPIARFYVHCLFRWVAGTVWFDDARVYVLDDVNLSFFDAEPVEEIASSIPAQGPSDLLVLASGGLELRGDKKAGWIRQIALAGTSLPAGRLPGGVFVQNARLRGDIRHLSSSIEVTADIATQRGPLAPLDLDVCATLRSAGDRIAGRIELTGTKAQDLPLSVVLALPINAVGWIWHDDVRRNRRIEANSTYENSARMDIGKTGNLSRYPMAVLTDGSRGLVMAVPLDEPRAFRIAYDAAHQWLYAAFDLVLSPDPVKLPNRATVEFELYGIDARWGFRAALNRYYELHPAGFARRVKDVGLWMPFAKISQVQKPEDFGFYFKEGLDDQAYDNAHNILTFRYTEPQSHWLPMPKGTSRTYDEAVALLNRRAQEGDPAGRRSHQAALASVTVNGEGRYHLGLYDTPWCDGGVFALNPDPDLPGAINKGKFNYDANDAEKLYADDPQHGIDGEYLDSLDGWSHELNFRRDHFRWVDIPLVFDTEGRRPCIINAFSIWEFVRWMSNQVHARGRLMMANYTPTEYPWQVPYLDVMGQETNWNPGGQWQPMSDADLCYRRSLCATKPYVFLQNSDFTRWTIQHTRWYMMRAGAYGMPPSFFSVDAANNHYFQNPAWYERDRPVFRQLVPIIRKIAWAGWRPIPWAEVEPAPLQVERFGDRAGGIIYLTVHNPDERAVSGRLVLHPELKTIEAANLLSGQPITLADAPGGRAAAITVPGRETLFVGLR